MFIWRGWGIIALLIPAMFLIVGEVGLTVFLEGNDNAALLRAFLFFMSGAAVWKVGRKLNNAPFTLFIDPRTRKIFESGAKHTLFRIPAQWFAVLWLLCGMSILIWHYG
ncbi:MAG: hypothetical protein LBQ63_02480 [Deltaproteobacteria bacterium]|nr:hypothetical protein [Deltaproteobacteria bacterium]